MIPCVFFWFPHNLDRKYIENLTTRRPQGANDVVIHDIDDPRNGLFLNMNSRSALGKEFAILRVRMFSSSDIQSEG